MSKDLDPKYKALEDLRRKEEAKAARGEGSKVAHVDRRALIRIELERAKVSPSTIATVLALAEQMVQEGPRRDASFGTVVDLCDCGQPDCSLCSHSGVSRSR